MISQFKFREIVFQLLYALGQGDSQEEDVIPLLMRECKTTRPVVSQAYSRAQAVLARCAALDAQIASVSQSFALERIGKPERCILRLALFEKEEGSLSKEIVISEAVRLTRKFSTPEAAAFVNAVLDDDASVPT